MEGDTKFSTDTHAHPVCFTAAAVTADRILQSPIKSAVTENRMYSILLQVAYMISNLTKVTSGP